MKLSLLTGAITIVGATISVMLGRYYERKKEIEAHFRTTKIEMYDQFLKELFQVFQEPEQNVDLIPFLREWQRKLVLWGGPKVLRTYFAWKAKLATSDASCMFAMDEFFRALRADVGQSSFGLERGAFVHLILRHPQVFLAAAKKNPKITLKELAELEKALGFEAGQEAAPLMQSAHSRQSQDLSSK